MSKKVIINHVHVLHANLMITVLLYINYIIFKLLKMSDYDENEAEKMSHELVHEILVAFVRSLKYIFLPLPKENYFEKWSKEGFP